MGSSLTSRREKYPIPIFFANFTITSPRRCLIVRWWWGDRDRLALQDPFNRLPRHDKRTLTESFSLLCNICLNGRNLVEVPEEKFYLFSRR